jgi:predicted transcriptional regulator
VFDFRQCMNNLDITEKEFKVYEILLKAGASTVSDLSRKTKIDQRNIYDYIERLINKGLVGQIKKNNKRMFLGLNPVMFEMYIDEEIEQVDEEFEDLKRLLDTKQEDLTLNYITSKIEFLRMVKKIKADCEILIGQNCEEITENPGFIFFSNNNKLKKIEVRSTARVIALFYEDYFLLFSAAEYKGFFVKDKSFSDNMREYFK